ncbi:penicillin acylase family protein [Duganella sp. FT80W]|uniref:Penicillin acylase family protein n=1 Tax=Duganella guangzhouensis TaxID=2666084 RepID=A0A6I2L8B5_9BURK|nr:penicillin acylase family protein [Duganella guangzhouensis]MRW93447.1 penicillin acylase family protein [Duganella guangzhouensis]
MNAVRLASALAVGITLLAAPAVQAETRLRRTTDGVVHVRATDWRGLGLGVGYAQAQDALCTLADAFLTFEGKRSYYFGPEAKPAHHATFGRAPNLELDVFFRAEADDALVARYRAAQPEALRQMVEAYAVGYNRYLAQARRAPAAQAPACVRQPWVREISDADIYRRMYAANIAGGYARFIPELAKAAPGQAATDGKPALASMGGLGGLAGQLSHTIGESAGLGSNMMAFGRQATGADGVLLGNPHWYWGGPDRFYQMQLTIPGKIDVAGVAFLGIPVVMLGFNQQIAWSHTVSAARRFGLFELALDPADPTRYLVDGKSEAMQQREIVVPLAGGGSVRRVHYSSRYGPIIDLGGRHPAFGWGAQRALALRDINSDNFRIFSNFLDWGGAHSLDEFIAIQKRGTATPWVNTAAIGRGDPRVWYADMGAAPNVPDALRSECSGALAKYFAAVDPLTPLLDGSRSACDWRSDSNAVQKGALPATAMPNLLTERYIANMNDSYWLAQPATPLEGYPLVLGGERKALSPRARYGYQLAASLMRQTAGTPAALARQLMHSALDPRNEAALLFKQPLLEQACTTPDVERACQVLRRWNDSANPGDHGALLWDAFWSELDEIPVQELYATPFSSEAPLQTPAGVRAGEVRVGQALQRAVAQLEKKGWRLDEPLSARLTVHNGAQVLNLYGGCHDSGYFTVVCQPGGGYAMDANTHGNSYLQVVYFAADGVHAHTLLAHGQGERALDGGAADTADTAIARYVRKDWLRFPFTEQEIRRAAVSTQVLRE